MRQESIRVPSTGTNKPRAMQRKAIGMQPWRMSRETLRTVGVKGSANSTLVICSGLIWVEHVKLWPSSLAIQTSCDCESAFNCGNVHPEKSTVEQRLTVMRLLEICSLR